MLLKRTSFSHPRDGGEQISEGSPLLESLHCKLYGLQPNSKLYWTLDLSSFSVSLFLRAMASTLIAMTSNLLAMASNLQPCEKSCSSSEKGLFRRSPPCANKFSWLNAALSLVIARPSSRRVAPFVEGCGWRGEAPSRTEARAG